MDIRAARAAFEQEARVYDRALLSFEGVPGWDVYNCSIPFAVEGKTYLFGRVERRDRWADSHVRLFVRTAGDAYCAVPDFLPLPLEDPYIARVGEEYVLGGTHVRKKRGAVDTYYGYFYRGHDLSDLAYFTTGPDYMKDIRLVFLADGRIGVFSRPRSEAVRKKYGSESIVGFATMDSLDELDADLVEQAPILPGLFGADEWGGCNQCYLLGDGLVGVVGHQSYQEPSPEGPLKVYLNISFVLDPNARRVSEQRIIGTAACFPAFPAKLPDLTDCAFTSGIVPRADGKVDLYSGLGDTCEGRITIDDPFRDHGGVRWNL